ncbi:MAG: class I SAM-dependent methyltransferase [Thermoanaerobaculia bacterium]
MSRQGQQREKTYDNIRNFWEAEAAEIGNTPQVTIRDHYFRIHELQTLLTVIPASSNLLDVGCGTGFGTLALARRGRRVVGTDYSQEMIRWANRLIDDPAYRTEIATQLSPLWPLDAGDRQIEFHVGNIVDLHLPAPPFDTITGQRILINLPTHADQMLALQNLRRVATDDATLILVEATLQGHAATDAYRQALGLPSLEKYWHNCYVDESKYDEWPQHGWTVQQTLSFDTYMLLSKVVYPAACGPEKCAFLSGANQAAMEIATLFRTRFAAAEIGERALLNAYTERVAKYDKKEAADIEAWVGKHGDRLPDWSRLGHQRLVVARATR